MKLQRYKSSYVMVEEIASTQHYQTTLRKDMITWIEGMPDAIRR